MSIRTLLVCCVVSFGLVFGPVAPGEWPAVRGAKAPREEREVRTDLQSDPLPPGAVARLGTIRFRGRFDHDSPFLVFSPDGRTLASSGDGSEVILWDAATGKRLGGFRDDFPILAARFSPDGKELIAGGYTGSIFHWRMDAAKLVRQERKPLEGSYQSPVRGFISADAKTFGAAYNGHDGTCPVRLWYTATGQQMLRWQIGGEQPLTSATLSPDGKILFVSGRRNLIYLIDTATGKEIRRIEGPNRFPDLRDENRDGADYIFCLTPSPDGRFLAGGSGWQGGRSGEALYVWEVATGKLRHQIKAHRGRLAFSPDGKYLACGDIMAVHLYEIASGKKVPFEQAEGWMQFPAFSPDGKTLVAHYGTIRLWDVATGKRRKPYPGHDGGVSCLAFSPDGLSLASGSGEVIVWDLATRKPRHVFPGVSYGVQSLAYSPDGKTLASGDGGLGHIHLWDPERGRLKREFLAHTFPVQSLAFSPDGKALASAGYDTPLRLWDVASGRILPPMRGPVKPPDGTGYEPDGKSLTFAPDAKTLLLAATRGVLSLWAADSGRKIRDFGEVGDRNREIAYARFLPDGKTILSREFGSGRRSFNEVRFWDVPSGRLLRSFPVTDRDQFWMRLALSPDGKTLAISGGLWDTDTGQRVARLPEHPGGFFSLAFSPDGKLLATGGRDTTVLLWDVAHARLEHLWTELAATDPQSALAMKKLAAKPEEAVPFLGERLRQAAALEDRVRCLLADLDSDEFPVREKASAELEKLGPNAAFVLREALRGDPPIEVRRRIREVLDRMKRPVEVRLPQRARGGRGNRAVPDERKPPSGEPADEYSRCVRLSLAVLEEIGTPAARQFLEELAKRPASSSLAQEARTALERLANRPKSP